MQTDPLEIVKGYFEAFTGGSIEQAGQFLSEDFKATSPLGTTDMDKAAFLRGATPLITAFPDLKINLANIEVKGNQVTVTEEISATHTGPIDFSNLGLPVVAPTGKAVRLPDQRVEFTVENGKITMANNITPPSATSGLKGIYKAVGFTLLS